MEQLRAGIELIVKQMEDVLRSLNVQPVESVGAQFDPRVHEALESVDRNDLPDHEVLERFAGDTVSATDFSVLPWSVS